MCQREDFIYSFYLYLFYISLLIRAEAIDFSLILGNYGYVILVSKDIRDSVRDNCTKLLILILYYFRFVNDACDSIQYFVFINIIYFIYELRNTRYILFYLS